MLTWIKVHVKYWVTVTNFWMLIKINLATLGTLSLLHTVALSFKSEYAFLNTISESYHFSVEDIVLITLIISFFVYIIDGLFITAFLRMTVSLKFDKNTTVVIKSGDIFEQNGCIIIPANELFFDIVDDNCVASSSLHGQMLKRFWGGQTIHWYNEVVKEFEEYSPESSIECVNAGNQQFRKFPIGFTAKITTDTGKKFLCVALTHTDLKTRQCSHEIVAHKNKHLI